MNGALVQGGCCIERFSLAETMKFAVYAMAPRRSRGVGGVVEVKVVVGVVVGRDGDSVVVEEGMVMLRVVLGGYGDSVVVEEGICGWGMVWEKKGCGWMEVMVVVGVVVGNGIGGVVWRNRCGGKWGGVGGGGWGRTLFFIFIPYIKTTFHLAAHLHALISTPKNSRPQI